MKKQLTSVSILQSAKVAAAMYFVVSIPIVLLMAIGMVFSPAPGVGIFFLILMPVFYVIFGFIFSVIAAWVYNIVAARIGGFEFTTTDVA